MCHIVARTLVTPYTSSHVQLPHGLHQSLHTGKAPGASRQHSSLRSPLYIPTVTGRNLHNSVGHRKLRSLPPGYVRGSDISTAFSHSLLGCTHSPTLAGKQTHCLASAHRDRATRASCADVRFNCTDFASRNLRVYTFPDHSGKEFLEAQRQLVGFPVPTSTKHDA